MNLFLSILPDNPYEQLRVINITLLTLYVASLSTIISSLIGIPIGTYIGMKKANFFIIFRVFTHTLYGLPPVIAGLIVYMLLSRSGPLGPMGMLFTPNSMIFAQCILIIPLVIGLSASAVDALPKDVQDTAKTLGANKWDIIKTLLYESRLGLFTAVMIGFGRAISEVGAVILVGGNIKWHTQVLTTSIVLETQKGNFSYAILLGLILITIAFLTSVFLTLLQRKQKTGQFFKRLKSSRVLEES